MTIDEYKEIKGNILAAIDSAIDNGDWEDGLFFKNVGKKLKELRETVTAELETEEKAEHIEDLAAKPVEKADHEKIYISLYQADGDNIERWQSNVKALAEYNISRPVYSDEEHVRAMIRAKADAKREAYVVVQVPDACVMPPHPGLPTEDKYGHRLLSIKARSVRLENILEFVHNGERYRLIDEKLVQL